ncbi:hypothetical protein WJX73_008705 [Symbiochloris irregularis]|uniref:Tyrosine decarboxylase n=1 Tax=Symbiochloris irregularis TaxID=706552 RepID=A0AAW1P679_9CHLO
MGADQLREPHGGTIVNGTAGNSMPQGFQHPMGVEEFRKHGKEMVDFICDYHANHLQEAPVRSNVEVDYLRRCVPASAPEEGEDFNAVLTDVQRTVLPGVTHWQSPNFFAYFPANSSYPAMLGDMLSSAFNVIGFSWISSPACTELEAVVLDWLAKLLDLPPAFLTVGPDNTKGTGGGVIQGTASEATLVALLAARAQKLKGRDAADALKLVAYTSDQAHSCVMKACMIAGIQHVRVLPTSAQHDWALQSQVLQEALEQDEQQGLLPFFLCATAGTTSSCAIDSLELLGTLARQHSLWMHVDAAYAGVAAICPEHRQAHEGLHLAHSFATNAHKWLLTNFDCCCLWVADAEPLKAALSLTPVFLRAKGNALDYKDWQVPLGRRFRSLKLWFVLRCYGQRKLQEYIRHHIALATSFAARVRSHPAFEIMAPPRFGLVCFALKGQGNEVNKALLESLNQTGRVFLVGTELGGRFTLRMAIGSATTQAHHVEAAWQLICQHAEQMLANGQHSSIAN